MNRFRLSRLAKYDLADIRRYIARDKPLAADRQIATLGEKFAMLARNPELGERRPEWGEDLRSFVVRNYVIIYRPTSVGVEIARVVSGYRDLEALF
jgi:toxin ParE1/3/4